MDYILKILQNKFKSEKWISENFSTFYIDIHQSTPLNISWKEKLYLHLHSMNLPPTCYCGCKLQFMNLTKGYRKYCSKSCLSNDPKIIEKRKSTSLKKWGTENPMQSGKVKDIYKKSILAKFGVDNVSKSDDIKKLKFFNNIEKYGVGYNSQRPEVRDRLKNLMLNKTAELNNIQKENLVAYIKNKILSFNLEFIDIKDTSIYQLKCQLGHEFEIHKNNLNDRTTNKNTICTICNPINNQSDAQEQLRLFIRENYSGEIIKNDRKTIGLELDIYLPELKLAFEYNGIFWHSELYKGKNYHLSKTNLCLDNDIQLIHIWEDDWILKNQIIKSRIKNLLGKSTKLYARQCQIKKLNFLDSKKFLEDNHIQGSCMSKVNIGLYHNNKLVSIMTFGNLRKSLGQKSKKNHYELLRFCNQLNMTVIGGASRLFTYFIKNYEPESVISYADRCWSNGNLYRRLGFKKVSITQPNYYYVVGQVRKNRFNYRKDKLVKMGYDKNKSESLIMEELGYHKIYDSGNLKYEWIHN